MNDEGTSQHERQLVRGAVVNAAGTLAKLAHPLFFVAATRMFGTHVMGAYLVASFIVQVAVAGITSGYHQGTIVFASAHADDEDNAGVYQVLANAYAATTGLGLVLVLLGLWGLEPVVRHFYPDRPGLLLALQIVWWSLPLSGLTAVSIGATKARMRMEYDALINGLVRPLSLLALAVLAWQQQLGLWGLALAHALSEATVAAASLWAVSRHYSLSRTVHALGRLELDANLLRFALPQSLDVMFNRYLTRLDVIMLAALGHTNHEVAFYSAAALVTDTLRQVRISFSTALAPIVARDHAAGDRRAMANNLSRVTRWTTTLVIPLAVALLVVRNDVLALIDPAFVGDTRFMALLLLPPFISCATGLAGNYLVFTRHSGWNLTNSLAIAALNTVFNLLLIPGYGLLGAALGTVLAAASVGILQVVELAWLEGVRVQPRQLRAPALGLLALAVGLVALWDPALRPIGQRSLLAAFLPAAFFLLMWVLGHPEVRATTERLTRLLRRLSRRPNP